MGCSSSAAVAVKEKSIKAEQPKPPANNQVVPLGAEARSEPQTAEKNNRSPRGEGRDGSKIKLVKIVPSEGTSEQIGKSLDTIAMEPKPVVAKEQTQPLRRLASTKIHRLNLDPLSVERSIVAKMAGTVDFRLPRSITDIFE